MKPSQEGIHNHAERQCRKTRRRRKQMNRKIASVLIGILLIGVVSAGLVTYLSNVVTGSVQVEGPVFYLDGSQPIGSPYWGLSINEEGISHDPVQFTGSNNKYFVSPQLGVDSFYQANYDLTLSMRTEDHVGGRVNAVLSVVQGESPYLVKETICGPVFIDIPARENNDFYDYVLNCPGIELDLDPTDRFVLQINDGLNDITYYIELNGNSKIETNAL